ncbi:MAG: hypothetical protein DWI02_07325 [Planctomycetota bacterium]|nr:MAG: hypothetical protein DWI02_07325 [Planctomycetota bacterium]
MGVDIMTMTFWGEFMETGIFVAGDPRATGSSQHLIFAVIQELGSFQGQSCFVTTRSGRNGVGDPILTKQSLKS